MHVFVAWSLYSLRFLTPHTAEDDEEDFEARIAALKRAKGETPYGEGAKKKSDSSSSTSKAPAPKRKVYDYTDETLYFESTPHLGDVAVNVVLGATLVWLPLSIAAVGRAAFIKYRFTDKRITCITTAPWKNEQLDAAYQEVKDVVTIGRGIGLWGDMLVTLKDGSKIEMRALPRFMELKEYILKRRDELSGGSGGVSAAPASVDGGRGFSAWFFIFYYNWYANLIGYSELFLWGFKKICVYNYQNSMVFVLHQTWYNKRKKKTMMQGNNWHENEAKMHNVFRWYYVLVKN